MTKSELRITEVLDKMRECISKGRLTFSMDEKERLKNTRFLRQYLVSQEERVDMLKSLTFKNFAQEELDRYESKPKEKYYPSMYIFKLEKDLKERLTRKNKRVEIYIKIQFFKLNDKEDGTLTISFHEEERPLKYMFN